jgi:hypothetical protein
VTLRWAESLENLPNAAAFPYEGVPENFQFLVETILVTDDYGSVYPALSLDGNVTWHSHTGCILSDPGSQIISCCINIQERRWPSVHIHGKLDIEVYVAEMAKEVVQTLSFCVCVGGGGGQVADKKTEAQR